MTAESSAETGKYYVMKPIHNAQNKMFAMELVAITESNVPMQGFHLQKNSAGKHHQLIEQLECVTKKKKYFLDKQISLSINIDFFMATYLLQDSHIKNLLEKLPFIHFEINENFPNLSNGKRDPVISELYHHYPLWLGNFGQGNANGYAVSQSLFRYVKLDEDFYREMIRTRRGYLLPALISNIKRYCHGVIIKGVHSQSEFFLLRNSGADGIQGDIFINHQLKR